MTDIAKILKDGGYRSRKFWLVVMTQAQIVGFAALAGKYKALGTLLPTVATALIGAAALFITGNVAAKQVLGKQLDVLVSAAGQAPEPKADEQPAS